MERPAIPTTLTQFIIGSQPKHSHGEFTVLMMAIKTAVKVIENHVRQAGMQGLFGHLTTNATNATGDTQAKLDILANDAFKAFLVSSTCVSFYGSEEEEHIHLLDINRQGHYLVFFDPLDGSSNIDANVSVGSVWGIWRLPPKVKMTNAAEAFKMMGTLAGDRMVSAGYAMFGSATNLVMTTGNGVHGFTLDSNVGEFVLTHPNITIPRERGIFSVNEGNYRNFEPWFRRYLDHVKSGKKPYSARYIGSMVADVHRTLLYGGIFCYPSDRTKPQGKLRLLYEAAPMAMLVEQAGGKAVGDSGRILEVVPQNLHQRVPVYLGSRHEVDLCMSFCNDGSKL